MGDITVDVAPKEMAIESYSVLQVPYLSSHAVHLLDSSLPFDRSQHIEYGLRDSSRDAQ